MEIHRFEKSVSWRRARPIFVAVSIYTVCVNKGNSISTQISNPARIRKLFKRINATLKILLYDNYVLRVIRQR